MDLCRPSLILRLPLFVLVCGLLFGPSGNFSPGDNLAIPGEGAYTIEVAYTLEERDGNKSFDDGLPVVNFNLALIQHFNRFSLDHKYVPQVATLELRATGPPYV